MASPGISLEMAQVTTELAELTDLPVLSYLDKTDITYRNTSLSIVRFLHIPSLARLNRHPALLHWMCNSKKCHSQVLRPEPLLTDDGVVKAFTSTFSVRSEVHLSQDHHTS